jgi:GNAT superfamily N-acetyltransferase
MGWVRIERLQPDFADWSEVLNLIRHSFAYMDGVIDPPSSAHRLTLDSLKEKAGKEIVFAAYDEDALIGCVFIEFRSDSAYVGKLAIDPQHQQAGIGRLLIEAAEKEARHAGLQALELQTRVELTGNHAAFARLGFHETGRTAHPGFERPTSITMRKLLA